MSERQPEPTELDDIIEDQIDRMMNNLGISLIEAKHRLGVLDDKPVFTRDESMQLHPSNVGSQINPRPQRNYESRYDGDTFPVIDTTRVSAEQVATNAIGAALARRALKQDGAELDSYGRARARAKRERIEKEKKLRGIGR